MQPAEPVGNARFRYCRDSLKDANGVTDPVCQNAANDAVADANKVRAINCTSSLSGVNGVIGLRITYQNGKWHYADNISGSLVACSDNSTLVADWSNTSTDARFRFCTDASSNPNIAGSDATCVAATQNGGSGSNGIRAINCGNSSPAQGQVALRLTYQGGHWMYYDNNDSLTYCREGGALVEEPHGP